jgi:serine protease
MIYAPVARPASLQGAPSIRRSRFWAPLVAVALISLLAAQPVGAATPQVQATPQPGFVPPAQVLVHWSASASYGPSVIASQTTRLQVASASALQYVRRTASGAQVYRLPAGADQATVMAQLLTVPGVVSVAPDAWMTPVADQPTNDTYATNMWALMGPAQGSQYGIDAVDAWPLTTGQGVVVAVIDTGLLFDHPDLAGQSVAGYDLISDYGQATPQGGTLPDVSGDGDGRDPNASDPGDWPRNVDQCGSDVSSWHGTHVAGTIAALANNGLGVFGGAPGVRVQPVRVLGHCGGYMSDVIDGIYWAAGSTQVSDGGTGVLPANPYADCASSNPCVRVLNLSLAGQADRDPNGNPVCDQDLEAAVQYARNQDKVVVAAAGNDSENARYVSPANCAGAFTVAATNANGKRAWFSNFGSTKYPLVDIAAPGVNILSTINSGAKGPSSNYNDTICYYARSGNGCAYDFYEGTSMATPHVSLTAALVAAENPALTPDDIEGILRSTAQPFPYSGARHSCSLGGQPCGVGIVNAAAAVAAAAPPATVPGVPTNVAAAAGIGAIAVTWEPPANDGGSPITGYEAAVTSATTPGTPTTCSTEGTLSCTVSGLADDDYTVTVTAENAIGAGEPSDPVGPITVPAVSPADTQPPAVSAPVLSIAGDQSAAGSIALDVNWPAATDANGVAGYLLQASIDGGPWTAVSLATPDATSVGLTLDPGSSVELRLAAQDTAGNWSSWASAASSPLTLSLVQEKPTANLVYHGRFRKRRFAGASGGGVRATGHIGRTATFTFSGSSVAFVSTLSPRRGIATIQIDGGAPQTIDLYHASPAKMAHVAWASGLLTDGPHTVVVTVTGTRNPASSRKRVDIDAFLTL